MLAIALAHLDAYWAEQAHAPTGFSPKDGEPGSFSLDFPVRLEYTLYRGRNLFTNYA